MMQNILVNQPSRGHGIGASLAAMVLAGFIPILAFAGLVVYLFAQQYQSGVRDRLIGVAQATSIVIDRELSHQIFVLEAISRSHLFDRNDLPHLHADLQSTQAEENWLGLSVIDAASGRQIFNTRAPMGTVLPPPIHPESLQDVIATANSRIVGIQEKGTVQLEPFVLLRVPVVRRGKVLYVLSVAFPPSSLSAIVGKQHLPENTVIAVIDSEMRIAARNRAQEQFIGTRITPTLAEAIQISDHGLFTALTKEGHPVYTVFRKSPETGWAIAIGIPAAVIDAPFHRTMLIIGGIGAVLVASGIGLAVLVGRTIRRRRQAEAAYEAAQAEIAARERAALLAAKEQAQRESEAKSASLKDVEAKLMQAQKLEAVGQLTGGLAHDFNNLLLVIIGNAEMLTLYPPSSEDARQAAELIQTAAERGAELTHRLLAFSRRQMLEPVQVNLNRVVENMGELLRRTLGEAIEVETHLAADLNPALADAAQVESALLNLAINARDAMPEGGRLVIETSNAEIGADNIGAEGEAVPGSYTRISVSDTGTGMTPDVAARAFEPFFTTKGVGKGSGLGLSMIYGFAKQSGGFVRIYSEVGLGTTVRLYLPQTETSEQAVIAPRQNAEPAGNGETILLVEDAAPVRDTAATQLRNLGYTVIEAESGPSALEALERAGDKVDLLFTDIVMAGGMTGRDLATEAQRRRPGLRVLFTSGYTAEAIAQGGALPSAVPLLQKPYRRSELAERIRQALRDQ